MDIIDMFKQIHPYKFSQILSKYFRNPFHFLNVLYFSRIFLYISYGQRRAQHMGSKHEPDQIPDSMFMPLMSGQKATQVPPLDRIFLPPPPPFIRGGTDFF